MNLREWARATHRKLANLSPGERRNDLSAADVELIMRVSLTTLIAALAAGEDLRTEDLGRIWCVSRPSQRKVSNLVGGPHAYDVDSRKVVRFRASSRLNRYLNSFLDKDQLK